MKNKNHILLMAIVTVIALSTILASLTFANAQIQVPNRKTSAYLSVNPKTVGLNQDMTVNLWIYPSPAGPNFEGGSGTQQGFDNITITFTRPDGTKDTFMPTDGSAGPLGLKAGQTESIGAIWFSYKPNQIGTWSVQFSFPGKSFTRLNYTVYYEPSVSPVTTFTVQKDLVQIGLTDVPLPTGYWERPISAENRMWYQISGNWMAPAPGGSYNPYSKAPNSAHILWKTPASLGGIIGGDWGSISYGAGGGVGGGGGSPPIIWNGRVYFNLADTGGNAFRCVDLRTGELLWKQAGSISVGQIAAPTGIYAFSDAVVPIFWGISTSSWVRYDPFSGAVQQTISTGVLATAGVWLATDSGISIRQGTWSEQTYRRPWNELMRWNLSKVTGGNWSTGIEWRISLKQADGTGPGEGGRGSGILLSEDMSTVVVITPGEDKFYAYDTKTGSQLWIKNIGHMMMLPSPSRGPHGSVFSPDSQTGIIHLFDLKTGNQVWETKLGEYPWGSNTRPYGYAYGMVYMMSYDGHVYALDETNGQLKWSFYTGNTTETPFGTWPPFRTQVIADGKYYIGTSEHSPTQPRIRGNKFFALDAFTGKCIWNISGAMGALGVADGYLIASSEYDGLMYAFGKGKTSTDIALSSKAVTKGSAILIDGNVLDQSPAQPGTPAISDADMSAWMEYVHMQKPMPSNVKGVEVILTATAPDGSTINIGKVTSDGYGYYQASWTPPSTGNYKIQATFAGSESYWSSTAETGVLVAAAAAPSVTIAPSASVPPSTSTPSTTVAPTTTPQPSATISPTASPTVAPPPSAEAPSMTLYIAVVGAVVAIVVVIAVALLLRKRK